MMSTAKTSQNSIYVISYKNAHSRFDLDQNKQLYKIFDRSSGMFLTLAAPTPYTVDQMKFFLLYQSKQIELESKYYQRPDLLSFDEYGTEQLDWILMYINDVFCYEEFVGPYVYVPSFDAIQKLLDVRLSKKHKLVEVW